MEMLDRCNKEVWYRDIAQLGILHTPYVLKYATIKQTGFALSENTETFHY